MLAIQARSFSNYFYLQSNNTNQPSKFIDNKVTGILFENKVDHASTYNHQVVASLPFPILGPTLSPCTKPTKLHYTSPT